MTQKMESRPMQALLEAPVADSVRNRSLGERITLFIGKFGALVVLGLLLAIFYAVSPRYFLTWANIVQIFNQSALTAVIACGLTIVLATNQFDLSIGSTASFCGIIVAILMLQGVSVPLAITAALAAGGTIGLVNGLLVTRLNVNALVGTLGVSGVVVGLNFFVSGGMQQPFVARVPNYSLISVGEWLGVPHNVYYMALVLAVLWVILNKTDLGRNMRAVGGNIEAARRSGVRVKAVTTAAFVISGLCAAITGLLLASVVGSGQPTGGDGYTMQAFSAAFLGTAVVREGEFHILGTLVGVVTVAVGFNGLALAGVPSYIQFLFQGVLLIAAVSFSSVARQLSKVS